MLVEAGLWGINGKEQDKDRYTNGSTSLPGVQGVSERKL